MFQRFNLFPHLTAIQNITLAPRVVEGIPRVVAEKDAMDLLDRVGLASKAGAYPHQLSGGQQQRVAIARSLAQKPQVMFCDEPTSALDPEMKEEVLQVLKGLSRSGLTMLIMTHEVRFAEEVAHRVWEMRLGKIASDRRVSRNE